MSLFTKIRNQTNTTENLNLLCDEFLVGVIFWMCTSVVCLVFGFPGALAVLWDMLQRGRKRNQITPYDVFLINVTIIDGFFLFFNSLEMCNYKFWHNKEFEAFVDLMYSLNTCGRPLLITCICVDCYFAVVHPVVYRANKSLTPRVLTSIAVLTVTLVFEYSFSSQFKSLEKFHVVSVIPLTLPVITFCDASILWNLKRSNPAGGSIHPKKMRAMHIIINNIVLTSTSYLPPVIGALVSMCLKLDSLSHICLVLTPVLCSMLVGNTVSPFLYLSNMGKLDWLKSLCKK